MLEANPDISPLLDRRCVRTTFTQFTCRPPHAVEPRVCVQEALSALIHHIMSVQLLRAAVHYDTPISSAEILHLLHSPEQAGLVPQDKTPLANNPNYSRPDVSHLALCR